MWRSSVNSPLTSVSRQIDYASFDMLIMDLSHFREETSKASAPRAVRRSVSGS